MQKFEKLAEQFEATGDLLVVEGLEEAINDMAEDEGNVKRAGRIYKMVSMCLKQAPDAMRKLAAIELEKPVEEVEEMSEEAVIAPMVKAFSAVVIPFFVSAHQQDGTK